jgi:hypothetical protein
MAKKRELREEIERLRSAAVARAERDADARRKADEGMSAALKSMVNDSFLVVTGSGHVLTGRATEVVMDQPTRNFSFDGKWLDVRPAGPKKYSASITIEPLK